jgi:multidrug resistance efflux pump
LTLESAALAQKHARLADELRTVQAELEAEAVKLRWQAAFHFDHAQGAAARSLEALGQLLAEQARVDQYRGELERAERLARTRAVSEDELDRLKHQARGQALKVEQLQAALAKHKEHADLAGVLLSRSGSLADDLMNDGKGQLGPFAARIRGLLAERARVAEEMERGRVVAPCNGLVVRLHRLAGEACRAGEAVVSFLEEGSLQVVLYMPQKRGDALAVGDAVRVAVEPYAGTLEGTVGRVGDRFEPAPESIRRHYYAGERLLPVVVRPAPEAARWMALRVDSVVKLP